MHIFGRKKYTGLRKHLIDHPIFHKIDFGVNFQIGRIQIDHKAKRNMTHTFLKIYFTEFKKAIRAFVTGDMDKSVRFIEMFTAAIDNATQEADIACVPEVFIKKYKLIQQSHIESIYESLANIESSAFYQYEQDKISAMLDVLIGHFVFIILDSEKTLNELNGTMEEVLSGSIFED